MNSQSKQEKPTASSAQSSGAQTSGAPVQRKKSPDGDYASQSAARAPDNQPDYEAQAAALAPVQMEEAPGATPTQGEPAAPEGASAPGNEAEKDKPRGPVWLPFGKDGNWDPQEVLSALSAVTSVTGPLRDAINGGPKAVAKYCVTLRDAADKVPAADAKSKAATEASNALTGYVTALFYATRQSPLQYADLARVSGWSVEYGGASLEGGEAPPINMDEAAKEAAKAEAAAAQGKPNDALTAGQRYRAAVLKSLQSWQGVTEGAADGRFYTFCTKTSLESSRKAAGLKGNTVTTCISFLGQVQTDAIRETGLVPSADFADNGAYWYIKAIRETAGVPEGAFHPAVANMTDRPKPGDIIYLKFSKDVPGTNLKAGMFSHVGYLTGVEAAATPGGRERWTTTDGGQGSATSYNPQGQMISQGAEKIAASERWYDPTTRLMYGSKEAGQGGDGRYLMGWTDIEALFPAPPVQQQPK